MRITVLGKSPAWQDADGACSGYLVEEQGCRLLIDCGNGVFSKLRRFTDYVDVDAVVISHLHADHFLDLVPFAYALTYAPRQQPVPVDRWPGTDAPARPVLHAPPGARDCFRRVVGAWGNEDLIENAFDLREYDADETLHVGPLHGALPARPALRRRRHAVEVTSTADGGRRFTFGADSSPVGGPVHVRARHRPAADRGDAAAPERDGMRGHLTPARPASTGARRAPGGSCSPTSPTSWTPRGPRTEAERDVRRAGRDRARGRGLRALTVAQQVPAALGQGSRFGRERGTRNTSSPWSNVDTTISSRRSPSRSAIDGAAGMPMPLPSSPWCFRRMS